MTPMEMLRAKVKDDLEQTERAQPATDHKPGPRDFLDGYCEALRWVLTWMGPAAAPGASVPDTALDRPCKHAPPGMTAPLHCPDCVRALLAAARAPGPDAGTAPSDDAEIARLRVALEAAADGLRSAATYLRHVNAFAFAEQVEIDEKHARDRLAAGPYTESAPECQWCERSDGHDPHCPNATASAPEPPAARMPIAHDGNAPSPLGERTDVGLVGEPPAAAETPLDDGGKP